MLTDNQSGTATETLLKIELSADTKDCNITNVQVKMYGQDAEYWAGTYGAFWKDMDLYVIKPDGVGNGRNSVLNDESEWHVSGSSAIARDDSDGVGKEIQFSYYWDNVWAEAR